jgi:hypothetical protein
MAGRRYFQHGHASITTANLSSGIGSLLRPATGLAALAAMALVFGLISSCVGPAGPTGGLLNRMASVVTADDPAGAPSAPSMLDNALSRVRDTAQLPGAPEVASGLQSSPLDVQRGNTGSGIWLHGTPREQFVRAPQASDGCVVLSSPDLERLLKTVQIRTTPVVIAPELQWLRPEALDTERQDFEAALEVWRVAKSEGNLGQIKGFYSCRFQNQGRDLAQWWPQVESQLSPAKGSRELQLKELSLLRWRDAQDTMVVTFGEVPLGQSRGVTRRQYWALERDQWKIFSEGTL